MRLQNKPQMVEAVMFFTDQKISKQMLYPEFEAVLDGMVNMPEYIDQQVSAVYVLINPRLLVRSLVFFYIDFDEQGAADRSWNIPLRQLAERAGRGPDLGAGPIRLACRSQASVPWHRMHLWDPELSPKNNHLLMVRDAVRSNSLGLLADEAHEPFVATERLKVAAEERWESASQMDASVTALEREKDQEQRQKAAQIIKQQRLRISGLETQYEAQLTKLRVQQQSELAQHQQNYAQLKQQLIQQKTLNAQLQQQLQEQAGHSSEQVLERLSRTGVVFVACHPGVGHITIPLQDVTFYLQQTMQYVAKKCAVTEDQYLDWLAHYEDPICTAKLDGDTLCGLPLGRESVPGSFMAGESDRCSKHKKYSS